MKIVPKSYIRLLKRRNFFILILVIFIGQLASAFLMLSLVVSTFAQTGSNFGVSGAILSFTIPSFLLMALAGLAADIIDRKKIIIAANLMITIVVGLILFWRQVVFASLSLSFLYFAGNAFFIPASSAASAQLVRKSQLLAANTIFIFTLSSGIILGLFAAAVIHFFFSNQVTLVICVVLLALAAVLSFLLPKLSPRARGNHSIVKTLREIRKAFIYILRSKVIWFFFLIFALMQGVISFGVTLAPGFFDEVVGLSVNKSPIFVMPLIGVGVLLGIVAIHIFKIRESTMVNLGIGTLGLATLLVSLVLRMNLVYGRIILVPVGLFLVGVGFGVILAIVGSRTDMQKNVAHNFQGTVFGANILLASFLGAVMAPTAAALEVLLGYVNVLLVAGVGFLILAIFSVGLAWRWKF